MAVSAFKSASRRGAAQASASAGAAAPTAVREASRDAQRRAPPRRSRSVSASSRVPSDTEFLNKRDNPLFCSGDSPPENGTLPGKSIRGGGNIGNLESRVGGAKAGGTSPGVVDERRGRSISRKGGVGSDSSGDRRDVGRSLSRVDTGRRVRSVSRNPVSRGHFVGSESEVEPEHHSSTKYKSSRSDVLDQRKDLRTWTSQHPSIQPPDDSATSLFSHWEDGVSVGSFSGVEEKTINAVSVSEQIKAVREDHLGGDASPSSIYETVRSEVRRAISDIQTDLETAIRRSNTSAIGSSNVADIPPDLVNPEAVELVMDIRREYAEKLEESQERARKLRADLAVEEHRGQELSRILKEILPDPRASSAQKSRPGRKGSLERRKMSKRLTEEALAYFDECVSLSTFDSSDFSSPEDPPLKLVGDANPLNEGGSVRASNLSVSAMHTPSGHVDEKQQSFIEKRFELGGKSSRVAAGCSNENSTPEPGSSESTNRELGWQYKFSFSGDTFEYFDLQHDISNCIKGSKNRSRKDDSSTASTRSNYFHVDEYDYHDSMQSLLADRVTHRNRLESGGFLVCGGGVTLTFSPFGSFI
ncbi:uncharacterized protein LOC115663272 isoform X2 [Syzygium oleosum]|uniref:uncharacterized protein LOC115663272 isoform X2 n=1 Tax=Syzygium oleosum TaxID=219896 RepID=UPI0011D2049F|nr:uncharacterized protein LOC115663272 isoform X2 [Syzygium oleosum]